MPDDDEKDKNKKDKVKKKARSGLSTTAGYEDMLYKLSSKGRKMNVQDLKMSFYEWCKKHISDRTERTDVFTEFCELLLKPKPPTREELVEFFNRIKKNRKNIPST